MNKYWKYLIVGIIFLLICIGLSGCNDLLSDDNNNENVNSASYFIGSWSAEYGRTMTLFSDGTGSLNSISCYWELKDGKFVINLYNLGQTITYDYEFSNKYVTLTLTEVGTDRNDIYSKQ